MTTVAAVVVRTYLWQIHLHILKNVMNPVNIIGNENDFYSTPFIDMKLYAQIK